MTMSRTWRVGSWLVALALGTCCDCAIGTAAAIEIDLFGGALSGSFDTTVTSGVLVRVADPDDNLIGLVNGGTAYSVNNDDGNLNYDKGDPTSAQIRANHELQLRWRNFSTFWRAYYFYDPVIKSTAPNRTTLSDTAKNRSGLRFRLLDAFLAGNFDLFAMPLTVRVGNQVMNWGESTFIQSGINAINPIDVALLRVPGAELRNALLPVPALDVSLAITDQLSLEGFYQFLWVETELEPRGTYFSTTDIGSPGARFAVLNFGSTPDNPVPPADPNAPLPLGNAIPRGGDDHGKDAGQGGVALRYFEPRLWGTEFGLYYVHYHSRVPLISAITGTAEGAAANDYAGSASYFREYPSNIHLLGFSFSNEIGRTGIALQGELSARIGQPLQIDDVELLIAGFTPLPGIGEIAARNQIGTFGYEEYIRGWVRKEVVQPQVTVTKLFGPTLGADQLLLLGEIGATIVLDKESDSELRYEGPGTNTGGDPFFTDIGIQPATQTRGFADAQSWGYRLVVRPTFNRAIGGVINVEPTLAFQHDVHGTTPLPIANFVDERKAGTVAVRGIYLERFTAEVAYTNFFDGRSYNLVEDRDFVSVAFSYSF